MRRILEEATGPALMTWALAAVGVTAAAAIALGAGAGPAPAALTPADVAGRDCVGIAILTGAEFAAAGPPPSIQPGAAATRYWYFPGATADDHAALEVSSGDVFRVAAQATPFLADTLVGAERMVAGQGWCGA